jgi:hypothetical protein
MCSSIYTRQKDKNPRAMFYAIDVAGSSRLNHDLSGTITIKVLTIFHYHPSPNDCSTANWMWLVISVVIGSD